MTKAPEPEALAPQDVMSDVRRVIDAIDDELVTLFARRQRQIERAARVKRLLGLPARVPERVDEVLTRVEAAAQREGLSLELSAELWTRAIEWSIGYEERLMGEAVETAPKSRLAAFTLLVDDYDRAINYYRQALGLSVHTDERRGDGDRWVILSFGSGAATLRLAVARNEREKELLGAQAGSRVLLVVHTDDIGLELERFQARGVDVTEPLRHEAYGSVVVIRDLYGNRWDFVQPRRVEKAAAPGAALA
jgi:isochorismate pyruvate lyase